MYYNYLPFSPFWPFGPWGPMIPGDPGTPISPVFPLGPRKENLKPSRLKKNSLSTFISSGGEISPRINASDYQCPNDKIWMGIMIRES